MSQGVRRDEIPQCTFLADRLSIAIGLLVLLHQIQIPFFLYYPNTTDTVLISEPLDRYIFFITRLRVWEPARQDI
jgi:uncharacterized protein YhhL (DUF1145 family)